MWKFDERIHLRLRDIKDTALAFNNGGLKMENDSYLLKSHDDTV